MNNKLRSIAHTAWNEPRHFFFWLAMVSMCGFIAAVGSAARAGPKVWLAFIALGCLVCFVVSLPTFILAWIPPVRRVFSWLLCRRFLVLGLLITLVALFYVIEDWRGWRAWQNYRRAWEAKGERFDLASFVPPPVPVEQNFFETPLWNGMHFVLTNGTVVWSGTNWGGPFFLSMYGPNSANAPRTGNWVKAQRADLQAWQAFYRGTNNLFAAEGGLLTNYFPVAQEPQAAAADVLLALSKFETNRQLLIAAAARPQARFWVNYDAGFAALVPHLTQTKIACQYLALHADAALKAGDRATALEDLRLMFRLIESTRSEPRLISHLVRFTNLQIALQPVWEGLADRQWTEADLAVLESELARLDFLADYQFALRGERAGRVFWLDHTFAAGDLERAKGSPWGKPSWPEELKGFLDKALFRLIPAGWFNQNKLSLCCIHEKYLLPLVVNGEVRAVPPAGIRRANSVFEQQGKRPYNMLSRMLLSSLAFCAEKCAQAQSSADLARIACALERYRLANGQFPEKLEALAPHFVDKLPQDVINGQPLKYRRTEDGQFVLYSVGWNETDDGGTVGLRASGYPDWSQGDWVWRYPAR